MINKVAVIGSKGYIGKHVVWYLQNHYDCQIDSYDIFESCDINYHKIDLTDKESIKGINLDVDYIFNFAGLTGTYIGFDKYDSFININEKGLCNLLDYIRHSCYRPKVIFPSTRLVYRGEDKPLKEDDEKETKTLYAVNKLACEGLLQAYNASFDIPFSIFRICVPYGNLLSNDYSFGTVGFFIKQAKLGKDITLYGGGGVKRTFTHMEDLCYQIIEGAINKNSDKQIYNVGGEVWSLSDVAKIIASRYGVNVISVPWPEKDIRIESGHTYFDDFKIKSLLNIDSYKSIVEFSNDI